MLLAVPLTMTVKVFLDGSEELRWIGVAIGGKRNPDIHPETQPLEMDDEERRELVDTEAVGGKAKV